MRKGERKGRERNRRKVREGDGVYSEMREREMGSKNERKRGDGEVIKGWGRERLEEEEQKGRKYFHPDNC